MHNSLLFGHRLYEGGGGDPLRNKWVDLQYQNYYIPTLVRFIQKNNTEVLNYDEM